MSQASDQVTKRIQRRKRRPFTDLIGADEDEQLLEGCTQELLAAHRNGDAIGVLKALSALIQAIATEPDDEPPTEPQSGELNASS